MTLADVIALTRQLVAVDSVNPGLVAGAAGEAEIATLVADRLDGAGFDVRIVAAPSDPRRVSVLASSDGPQPGRTVVLNGHLDTVGVEGMDDPFGAAVVGDRLLGRGSCDMKGGVAGLIVAAEALAAERLPGRIVLALVADEEDASLGSTAVIDAIEGRADVCLVAEPTWLDVAVAHRGFAVLRVRLHGRAAHSSLPAEGVDVLAPLGRLLVGVSDRGARLLDAEAHPSLGHGSWLATVVRGGRAPFTVAAEAEVVIERRLLPGESVAHAEAEAAELLATVTGANGPTGDGVTWSVEVVGGREAWEADDHGPAAELTGLLGTALPAAGSHPPRRTGYPYWMESALWQAAGVPTVVCGPAGGGLHAIDEWVDLGQLRRFPVALTAAVGRFLAC